MASPISPRRFALLVGIDQYSSDGSRRSADGKPLSLRDLRGCVNDVRAIAELLRDEFQLQDPRFLTSPPLSSSNFPTTPTELRPTFDNIKREFDAVAQQAGPGDLFFFHFSGHGARLQPTSKSPLGRSRDPSLMTMDFCCGKPAVRGWQLNEWLKKLNEKKIRTIVTLDSCHSGGAFRIDGAFRTPEGWTSVANLPADEEATAETSIESGRRDGELETSWSINPDGFTLMAACESHELAAEKAVNGMPHGAFTSALLAYLKQNRPSESIVTYRTLRDQIAGKVNGQTPRVFGRDRLVFFGDKEPFSATPIVVRLEGERIYLPVGKAHGVRERSEFTTFPPTLCITFSVDDIDDFECSAPVPPAVLHEQTLQQHNYQIVPCRWSLGDDMLQVLAHPSLGSEFQQALHAALQDRIVGDIEITEANDSCGPNSTAFRLAKRGDGGIDLVGSPTLTGYEGPLRGLDLTGNVAQQATKSAAALAHLARFGQVLSPSGSASPQLALFELILKPKGNQGTRSKGQGINFVFKNTTQSQLHFTVLVLSSGFGVKQLYPSQDFPQSVDPGCEDSFGFSITIPDILDSYGEQRDIIRTVVTRGRQLSWKSLELPEIWNADQLACKRRGAGRGADLESQCNWWVKDNVILTTKQDGDGIYWTSRLLS